jgi:hypothetical protein
LFDIVPAPFRSELKLLRESWPNGPIATLI